MIEKIGKVWYDIKRLDIFRVFGAKRKRKEF